MLASDDSLFVFSGQVSRLFRPPECTAFAHTFVFPHTADFRRPALVESLRSNPTNRAFERASSRQTEVDAELTRKPRVDDSGETQPREFQSDSKWPAYTRFSRLLEIFFSCRKSCKNGSWSPERRFL